MLAKLRNALTFARVAWLCAALVLANSWGVLHNAAHPSHHFHGTDSAVIVAENGPEHATECGHDHSAKHFIDMLLGHAQDADQCASFSGLAPNVAMLAAGETSTQEHVSTPAPDARVRATHPGDRCASPQARGPPRLI